MRKGDIEVGFREIAMIALAILLLVMGALLIYYIMGPAIEAGGVYSGQGS